MFQITVALMHFLNSPDRLQKLKSNLRKLWKTLFLDLGSLLSKRMLYVIAVDSTNNHSNHKYTPAISHIKQLPLGHLDLLPFLRVPLSRLMFSAVRLKSGSFFLYSSSGTSFLCVIAKLSSFCPAFPPPKATQLTNKFNLRCQNSKKHHVSV